MAAIGTHQILGTAEAAPRGRLVPYLLVLPTLVVLAIVGVVPFVYAVFLSLHETQFTSVGEFSGVSNFTSLLGDGAFWSSVKITAIITAIAVPLEIGVGLGLAMLFYRGVYAGRLLSPLLLIPSMLAPIVVGIIWKVMLAGSWGVMTQVVIEPLGIVKSDSVFSSATSSIAMLIAVDVWQWTPFIMLALYAALQGLPLAPFRAAALDGASRRATFRHITLPMLYPVIAVLLLLRILDTFKIFDIVYVLSQGGPGDSTQVLSLLLYRQVFEFWEVGRAAAAAVILFIAFFAATAVLYRILRKRVGLV